MIHRNIKLIKNRSDIGAGTRGADMGIDAIEIAAINSGNDYFNRYDYEDVKTDNESIYNKVRSTFAKRIEYVYEHCVRVYKSVRKNIEHHYFTIVLSGDHSSALGTISGVKAAFPHEDVGVVWIDAHGDLHSPYTSPSGNIHGMPLAAAIANDNLDCQVNEVGRVTEKYWNALKHIGVRGPKVKPHHVVYFGVRSTESAEDHQMSKLDMRNYTAAELRYRGIEACLQEAIERLAACKVIYISFDVDSMDCDLVSDGTGTPVSKGLDADEVTAILNSFLKTGKVVCLEIVEVNPLLDTKGNKMAETAFRILAAATHTLEQYV